MKVEEIINSIVEEQSLVVGEKLAKSRAIASGVLSYDTQGHPLVNTLNDPSKSLEKLINSYRDIFGQASVDVCLNVMKKFPQSEIMRILPDSLKPAFSKV